MASKAVALTSDALRPRDLHLNPLDKVGKFFEALTELKETADGSPERNTKYILLQKGFRDVL